MLLRRAYDHVVTAHWRVAMRSDIVRTLPRAGYSHVGNRVALTTSGEIFLDPNTIETVLWPSAAVNVTDHGQPEYRKALGLFCNEYLIGFEPGLSIKSDDRYCTEFTGGCRVRQGKFQLRAGKKMELKLSRSRIVKSKQLRKKSHLKDGTTKQLELF